MDSREEGLVALPYTHENEIAASAWNLGQHMNRFHGYDANDMFSFTVLMMCMSHLQTQKPSLEELKSLLNKHLPDLYAAAEHLVGVMEMANQPAKGGQH